MRDLLNLDLFSFCNSIEEIAQCNLAKFLTTEVVDNSNFLDVYESSFVLPSNLDDLIALSICSWYIDTEWIRLLLQDDLRQKLTQTNEVLEFLLNYKGEMLVFLEETSLWHSRDFFGNIMSPKRIKKVIKQLKFKKKPTSRPVRAERKRGYHDHGSRRLLHEYHGLPSNYLTVEEVDQMRKNYKDTLSFIRGFLFGTG